MSGVEIFVRTDTGQVMVRVGDAWAEASEHIAALLERIAALEGAMEAEIAVCKSVKHPPPSVRARLARLQAALDAARVGG